jgi:hypothetical protein
MPRRRPAPAVARAPEQAVGGELHSVLPTSSIQLTDLALQQGDPGAILRKLAAEALSSSDSPASYLVIHMRITMV